jgi:hypothetical protein
MQVHFGHYTVGSPYPDARLFRNVVRRRLQSNAVPMVERQVHGIINNWESAPGVQSQVTVSIQSVDMATSITGPVVQVWNWVSGGVKGRWIKVRKTHTFRKKGGYKPALKLQRYRPKTLPGGSWGNPGGRYGPVGYRPMVWWPGIAPRNFEGVLFQVLYNPVMREMAAAVQEGFAAMSQRGTVGGLRRLLGR